MVFLTPPAASVCHLYPQEQRERLDGFVHAQEQGETPAPCSCTGRLKDLMVMFINGKRERLDERVYTKEHEEGFDGHVHPDEQGETSSPCSYTGTGRVI